MNKQNVKEQNQEFYLQDFNRLKGEIGDNLSYLGIKSPDVETFFRVLHDTRFILNSALNGVLLNAKLLNGGLPDAELLNAKLLNDEFEVQEFQELLETLKKRMIKQSIQKKVFDEDRFKIFWGYVKDGIKSILTEKVEKKLVSYVSQEIINNLKVKIINYLKENRINQVVTDAYVIDLIDCLTKSVQNQASNTFSTFFRTEFFKLRDLSESKISDYLKEIACKEGVQLEDEHIDDYVKFLVNSDYRIGSITKEKLSHFFHSLKINTLEEMLRDLKNFNKRNTEMQRDEKSTLRKALSMRHIWESAKSISRFSSASIPVDNDKKCHPNRTSSLKRALRLSVKKADQEALSLQVQTNPLNEFFNSLGIHDPAKQDMFNELAQNMFNELAYQLANTLPTEADSQRGEDVSIEKKAILLKEVKEELKQLSASKVSDFLKQAIKVLKPKINDCFARNNIEKDVTDQNIINLMFYAARSRWKTDTFSSFLKREFFESWTSYESNIVDVLKELCSFETEFWQSWDWYEMKSIGVLKEISDYLKEIAGKEGVQLESKDIDDYINAFIYSGDRIGSIENLCKSFESLDSNALVRMLSSLKNFRQRDNKTLARGTLQRKKTVSVQSGSRSSSKLSTEPGSKIAEVVSEEGEKDMFTKGIEEALERIKEICDELESVYGTCSAKNKEGDVLTGSQVDTAANRASSTAADPKIRKDGELEQSSSNLSSSKEENDNQEVTSANTELATEAGSKRVEDVSIAEKGMFIKEVEKELKRLHEIKVSSVSQETISYLKEKVINHINKNKVAIAEVTEEDIRDLIFCVNNVEINKERNALFEHFEFFEFFEFFEIEFFKLKYSSIYVYLKEIANSKEVTLSKESVIKFISSNCAIEDKTNEELYKFFKRLNTDDLQEIRDYLKSFNDRYLVKNKDGGVVLKGSQKGDAANTPLSGKTNSKIVKSGKSKKPGFFSRLARLIFKRKRPIGSNEGSEQSSERSDYGSKQSSTPSIIGSIDWNEKSSGLIESSYGSKQSLALNSTGSGDENEQAVNGGVLIGSNYGSCDSTGSDYGSLKSTSVYESEQSSDNRSWVIVDKIAYKRFGKDPKIQVLDGEEVSTKLEEACVALSKLETAVQEL